MGWSYGHDNNGREIGYSVPATCDKPDCKTEIHRGLSYRCGDLGAETGGNGPGCGGYFCPDHLTFADLVDVGELCKPCADLADDTAAHPGCEACECGDHTCECGNPTYHDARLCPVCSAEMSV